MEQIDLRAYASGAAMDCPVCGVWMDEGDDCPDEHYAQNYSAVIDQIGGE